MACTAAALAVVLVGCASWKEPTSSPARMNSDAPQVTDHKKRVILEVEFVNMAAESNDVEQSAALWQWVDETAIDAAVRRRWLANGIRAGFVANEERFRNRLADVSIAPDVVETFLSEASVASDVSHGEKRIPMRLGRRYELPLRQPIEGSHVTLVRVEDETIGRTLANAQYFFSITATSADVHKRVDLRIRPEIQYGETRQKWVSSDTAIRIDNRRDTWSIPELDLEVTASEHETLVIAAATPITGLAKQMLTGSGADQDPQQLVVLIRVVQVPSAVDQL